MHKGKREQVVVKSLWSPSKYKTDDIYEVQAIDRFNKRLNFVCKSNSYRGVNWAIDDFIKDFKPL